MSLLNDALRKKKKEHKEPGPVNLFQDKPAQKRDDRVKKYGLLALILVVCIVATWVVWLLIFQQGPSLLKPQIAGDKIIEPEPAAPVYKPGWP